MQGWFGKLRDAVTRDPVMHVEDPELGPLEYTDSWWECTVGSEQGPIKPCIGGRFEPDPRCIATARATAKRIDAFINEVKAHCNSEAAQDHSRNLPGAAEEIAALTIADIHYVWPRNLGQGMIYFRPKNGS